MKIRNIILNFVGLILSFNVIAQPPHWRATAIGNGTGGPDPVGPGNNMLGTPAGVDLRFGTNGGTERMRITSTGLVGIGTNVFQPKFHLEIQTQAPSGSVASELLLRARSTGDNDAYLGFVNMTNFASGSSFYPTLLVRQSNNNLGGNLFRTDGLASDLNNWRLITGVSEKFRWFYCTRCRTNFARIG